MPAKTNTRILPALVFGFTTASILMALDTFGRGDWVVVPLFFSLPGWAAAWFAAGGTHSGPNLWAKLLVALPVNTAVYTVIAFVAFFIRSKFTKR